MRSRRLREEPRVTKPYSEEDWARIDELGAATRTALEIAALDDSGDVAEIVAAVEVVVGPATSEVLAIWSTRSERGFMLQGRTYPALASSGAKASSM